MVNVVDAPPAINVEMCDQLSNTSGNIISNASCLDIHVYDDGNFEEVCVASIAQPLKMVEDQFKQLQWNDTPLEVHKLASDEEVCPLTLQLIGRGCVCTCINCIMYYVYVY